MPFGKVGHVDGVAYVVSFDGLDNADAGITSHKKLLKAMNDAAHSALFGS